MKQRPRIYYSDSQKAQMWKRWKEGWTLHEIGKRCDKVPESSSLHSSDGRKARQRALAQRATLHGGVRPV